MNYFFAREQCLVGTADGGFVDVASLVFLIPGWIQGCELDRFLTEFELKTHLQVRVQRFIFFEFKFEFGKNDRVRIQVRVHSPVQNIPKQT